MGGRQPWRIPVLLGCDQEQKLYILLVAGQCRRQFTVWAAVAISPKRRHSRNPTAAPNHRCPRDLYRYAGRHNEPSCIDCAFAPFAGWIASSNFPSAVDCAELSLSSSGCYWQRNLMGKCPK